MIVEVMRAYEFSATHVAEGMPPPWCEPHGHDYSIVVTARAERPNAIEPVEVVVDTDALDAAWEEVRGDFEDQHLNDTVGGPTTVEDLAAKLLRHFRRAHDAVAEVLVAEDDERAGRAKW